MFGFGSRQHVCTSCGTNVIGRKPRTCPFCGAPRDQIIDADTASRRFRVTAREVAPGIAQLRCAPRLGLEHAAYRIETGEGSVWIDCPSAFNSDLDPTDTILFTHKDFMGAANQYREQFGAEVWLHEADAELSDLAEHSVTRQFSGDVEIRGIRGLHIGGHTPGFTVYIWRDVLFLCDYAYPPGQAMKLNPHGPVAATQEGAGRLADRLAGEALSTVCGYNYVTPFNAWYSAFTTLI